MAMDKRQVISGKKKLRRRSDQRLNSYYQMTSARPMGIRLVVTLVVWNYIVRSEDFATKLPAFYIRIVAVITGFTATAHTQ